MTRSARVVLWACELCDRRGATTLAEARVAASRHARQEHPELAHRRTADAPKLAVFV
jgi:hypothetical protein